MIIIHSFAIYPLLKRVTHWPQAWLGFAMNFGFVTAWVATTGDFNINLIGAAMAGCWLYVFIFFYFICLPICFSFSSWTMLYGTLLFQVTMFSYSFIFSL